MTGMTIRRMVSGDLRTVFEIQAKSKEAAQWPRSAYEELLRAENAGFVFIAEQDGQIFGFLAARHVGGEMEILNMAINPVFRRKGIGGALLRYAITHASQSGVTKIFLEVRASNLAAQNFYRAHGFDLVGMRSNYYRDPYEDALLLALSPRTGEGHNVGVPQTVPKHVP